MAFDKDAIIASLKEASISDLNDLVKAIEEEFDVSATAPVAVAGAAGGEAAAKDSFTVELTSAGSAKVKVIKAVKDITGLGLKDAKDLVDNAPSAVKEDVKEDEANDIKEKLEAENEHLRLDMKRAEEEWMKERAQKDAKIQDLYNIAYFMCVSIIENYI